MTRPDVEVASGDRSETPHLVLSRARARQLPRVVEDLQDLLHRVSSGAPGRRHQKQRESVTGELHRLLPS